MKSFIIDTNGILRLLLNDIPPHADQVEKLIRQAQSRHIKIIIPEIVIFELNFILDKYYNTQKEEVIEKLKSLVSASYFSVESKDIFSKALAIYENKNISFVDAFLLVKAETGKSRLFTFDEQLKKLQSWQ